MSGPLFEEARPRAWAGVVGQDRALAVLAALRNRTGTLAGRAYWISGGRGTGKTTIAQLIAAEVSEPAMTCTVGPGEVTPAFIRDRMRESAHKCLGRTGVWAIIVDEAHGLASESVRQLKLALDPCSPWCTWVFTTTAEEQEGLFDRSEDAAPLLARCIQVKLARRDLAEPFARRAREVAAAAGLDGRPEADYLRLIRDCRNDLREALSRIESGAMMGGEA